MFTAGTVGVPVVPVLTGFQRRVGAEATKTGVSAGGLFGTRFGDSAARNTRGVGKRIGTGVSTGLTSSLKGATAAVGGLFAAGAATGFLSDSIGQARDLSETVNKSNVIFGKSAGSINAWSRSSAKSFGLTREAALGAAANFGNMFQQLGFGNKAAARASTSTVKLAADLGSFNNLETGDVLERISASLRGEYDSLQLLIPNINAARVEQVALARTGKTSAKQLTAQEKAAATLAIVQKDGAKAQGDFARTSDSLANRQKILGAQVGNLKGQLGMALLPAMTGLANFTSKTLLPTIGGFVRGMQQGTGAGGVLLSTVGGIKNALVTYAPVLGVVGGGLVAYKVATIGATVAEKGLQLWRNKGLITMLLYTRAQQGLNLAMRANPIGAIITALTLLGAGLVLAYKKSDTFRSVVNNAWAAVRAGLAVAWGYVSPVLARFRDFLGRVLPPTLTAFRAVAGVVFAGVAAYVRTWWKIASTVFGLFVGFLKTTVFPVIRFLYNNVAKPVFGAIGRTISTVWTGVIRPAFSAISTGASAVGTAFGAAKDAIASAWKKIKGLVSEPIVAVIKFVNGSLIGPINTVADKLTGKSKLISPIPEKFAIGGPVRGRGTGTSDSILARLSNGEFVVRAKAAAKSMSLLKAINAGKVQDGLAKYAKGGPVTVKPLRGGTPSTYPGHTGVDFNAPNDDGKPILAARAGRVSRIVTMAGSYGKHVWVNHGGVSTIYGHMSRFGGIKTGQKVAAGNILGYVGSTGNSTGPHLHFETRPGGTYGSAMAFLRGAVNVAGSKANGILGSFNPVKYLGDKVKAFTAGVGRLSSGNGVVGSILSGISDKLGTSAMAWVKGAAKKGANAATFLSPAAILGKSLGLFDRGGMLQSGGVAVNRSGKPEPVFTSAQWKTIQAIVKQSAVLLGRAKALPTRLSTTQRRASLAQYTNMTLGNGSALSSGFISGRLGVRAQTSAEARSGFLSTRSASLRAQDATVAAQRGLAIAQARAKPVQTQISALDAQLRRKKLTKEQRRQIEKDRASAARKLADPKLKKAERKRLRDQIAGLDARLADPTATKAGRNRLRAERDRLKDDTRLAGLTVAQKRLTSATAAQAVADQRATAAAEAYRAAQDSVLEKATGIRDAGIGLGSLSSATSKTSGGVIANLRRSISTVGTWGAIAQGLITKGLRGPIMAEFLEAGPSVEGVRLGRSLLRNNQIGLINGLQSQLKYESDKAAAGAGAYLANPKSLASGRVGSWSTAGVYRNSAGRLDNSVRTGPTTVYNNHVHYSGMPADTVDSIANKAVDKINRMIVP